MKSKGLGELAGDGATARLGAFDGRGGARMLMLALLLAPFLGACGGGGGSGQGNAPASGSGTSGGTGSSTPPAQLTQQSAGHYVGTVQIGDTTYFGDAVFTEDGEARLYIGGPYANDGLFQTNQPSTSAQFVGTVTLANGQLTGSGLLFGQECALNAANPLCGQPAPATISGAAQANTGGNTVLQGEIQVTTASGTDTWPIVLGIWSNTLPGSPPLVGTTAAMAGQYQEELAEFTSSGDVLIDVDSSGNLSFQSAGSGCVGNGALSPHLGGVDFIFDVRLTIEDCSGAFAYLNGEYTGLALPTASSYWDYDTNLRMWLSTPSGEAPPAAITTFGPFVN